MDTTNANHLDAQLFIDSEWSDAEEGRTLDILNPATGEVIGTLAAASAADVDRAVQAAHRAFEGGAWRDMPIQQRARVLNRFADLFEADLEQFYRLETLNNGRPISETRAQISRLPQFYRYFAALALTRRSDVIPIEGPYLCYTQRVPLGVVALMTSFNHPLMILSKSLAPALATGNSVVIKASEQTPLTTVRLVRLLHEAGVPRGVVSVVNGEGREAGAALAQHPLIRKVVFTGGTEVGRSIGEAAARNFAMTTLELGGKGAVILFDDFDIERAVNGAAFAAFIGAGQTCVCGARILVQRSMYAAFLDRFRAKAAGIRVGDPADAKTQLGPVISDRSRQRILAMLDRAKQAGAKILTGGGVPQGLASGFFLEPTVIYDAHPHSEIGQEEVFGPVTVVMPFEDEADAIRIANDTQFGLAASIWTQDVARAHRVAGKLEFGMVWVNDHHRLDPASPWGGFKNSGVGRETGIESFDQFSEPRAVTINTTGKTVDWYADDGELKRLN
ncbi:Aldehyde dehydrogenase [Paraburkholderia piptadeniae]|uniref:Aldehyde dehydrogenase n=1 Tax=Paraburkholderia piptadeniae TaxID=1701573 RepID=A0A1N7SVB9_9BURK|nr:aldehyde dehydrogenase [Paraburkholderia piptadeniae]SIT51401.1 Aldehyde dehydrogenase [Paraburkholderia piptadeniae]